MSENCIKINDLALLIRAGSPVTFQGKHSGVSLSGINLNFTITQSENIQKLEELFEQNTVQVYDPFVNRSYEATLTEISHSYQEGSPEYHYTAEIRELDLPPKFEVLEIEGHAFPVLEYTESDEDDDVVGRHAVLKLTKEQYIDFQNLLRPGAVQIQRSGVDEEPISVRYGGGMYWSEHKEEEELFYKQIVRFFPPDFPATRNYLASGVHQDNLSNMVQALSVRFESLARSLAQKKILSEQQLSALLGDDLEGLLNAPRVKEIAWELDKVDDAAEYI